MCNVHKLDFTARKHIVLQWSMTVFWQFQVALNIVNCCIQAYIRLIATKKNAVTPLMAEEMLYATLFERSLSESISLRVLLRKR